MEFNLAIYTAGHGLDWSYDHKTIDYESLARCRTVLRPVPNFSAGQRGYEGFCAIGNRVFVIRCFLAEHWDYKERNATYMAVAWTDETVLAGVDYASVLDSEVLRIPMRTPPKRFDLRIRRLDVENGTFFDGRQLNEGDKAVREIGEDAFCWSRIDFLETDHNESATRAPEEQPVSSPPSIRVSSMHSGSPLINEVSFRQLNTDGVIKRKFSGDRKKLKLLLCDFLIGCCLFYVVDILETYISDFHQTKQEMCHDKSGRIPTAKDKPTRWKECKKSSGRLTQTDRIENRERCAFNDFITIERWGYSQFDTRESYGKFAFKGSESRSRCDSVYCFYPCWDVLCKSKDTDINVLCLPWVCSWWNWVLFGTDAMEIGR